METFMHVFCKFFYGCIFYIELFHLSGIDCSSLCKLLQIPFEMRVINRSICPLINMVGEEGG